MRDRVVGFEHRPVKDFLANPRNFRRHPVRQREALRAALRELGWIGAVIENVRTGHLIDGHARIEELLSQDEDTVIPCVQVDLSEEEEALVLATYDPLGAMASADREALEILLDEVRSSEPALKQMLEAAAERFGISKAPCVHRIKRSFDTLDEARDFLLDGVHGLCPNGNEIFRVTLVIETRAAQAA